MPSIANLTTAGLLVAALGVAPAAVYAQSPSGDTASQSQATSSQPAAPQSASAPQQPAADAKADTARQHLTAARKSLEELTKLPAATQLQGEQRTMITQFISDFNSFATASTDWRGKYLTVDKSLDKMLNTESSPAAAPAPADKPETTGTAGTAEAAPAGGGIDPTIIEKLREVRTHLDAFEQASGDPLFLVDALEKALDDALKGSGEQAVGTSGTTVGNSAGGTVTIERAKIEEIRQQVKRMREALEK
jgi:hypothetical protein